MRKLLLTVLGVLSLHCMGQDVIEEVSYVSNQTIAKLYGLPIKRTVSGGTKINVDFVGGWTKDMEGAFTYACKLWEEAIPTTFPIRIKAVLDNTKSVNNGVLSKVGRQDLQHNFENGWEGSGYPYTTCSTWRQIKATKFHEFSGLSNTEIYDSVLTDVMFNGYDITITYYNGDDGLVNNCSFSLGEEIDNNLYDFVSLVLRDLAKGFGITWVQRNTMGGQLRVIPARILPYESHILSRIGYDGDNTKALQEVTKGSIEISDGGIEWEIYAPTTWDSERSLSYFIPDQDKKLTQLLSYEFGRGSVVRDFSDTHTLDFFRNILRWKGDILVGDNGGSSLNEKKTSTEDVVPYKGVLTVPTTNSTYMIDQSLENDNLIGNGDMQIHSIGVAEEDSVLLDSLYIYHPGYGVEYAMLRNFAVSLLLNNGKWDVVYSDVVGSESLSIPTNNFVLHYDIEEYARSCDGYLRCRVTENSYNANKRKFEYTTSYHVLDYLPQKIEMAKSRVRPYFDEEDYYRDVEYGIKNLEGTTKVIVSQLDEGSDLPYYYEITDFKKGYFVATVDREFTSTFVVTSYNKNGSTSSETFVQEPLTPVSQLNLDFTVNENDIDVFSSSRKLSDKQLISSYQINKISSNQIRTMNAEETEVILPNEKNSIDISSLDKGMYTLTVTDIKGGIHSIKFVKD